MAGLVKILLSIVFNFNWFLNKKCMISLWPYHARSDAFTGSNLGKTRMFQKRILLIINGQDF